MAEVVTLIARPNVRQTLNEALGIDLLEARALYIALKETKVFNSIFDIIE